MLDLQNDPIEKKFNHELADLQTLNTANFCILGTVNKHLWGFYIAINPDQAIMQIL